MNLKEDSFLQRTSKNLFSGFMGGFANCLTGHPFDTLKVRLQTQPTKNPIYNGLFDCFTKTIKTEGIVGLYKGVGSPLVGQMFFRGTLFAAYYQTEAVLLELTPHQDRKLSRLEYFFCGACAGLAGSFVEGPIDLFKTKMQVQVFSGKVSSGYKNVFHAGWVIARQHGVQGVYQGLGATMLRNVPSFCLYLGSYEILKDYFATSGTNQMSLTLPQQLICGATAGLFYWMFTFPTDVIKSSMQSDHTDKHKRKFKNILHCARTLYVTEGGWRRFFRGYVPCIMRTVPASASMLLVMETCRQYLN